MTKQEALTQAGRGVAAMRASGRRNVEQIAAALFPGDVGAAMGFTADVMGDPWPVQHEPEDEVVEVHSGT